MLNSPDRGLVRKKWAVNKTDGPLVMYAELVQKKLHHHKIPCAYTVDYDMGAVGFHPAKHRRAFSGDFRRLLHIAAKTVNADRRVSGYVIPANDQLFYVMLDGPHFITRRGDLKKGILNDDLSDADG